MFSKATANFVRQIDPEGSLIHVSRINDSHKLVPMAVVVKRNRIWFWQRPKYQPTDFILSDLLVGNKVLGIGVSETEFLSYKGTFGDKFCGKLDTDGGCANVTLEGQGSSKLQSCFGQLKKDEVDVKKLLHDSRDRLVDMQHVLVQQLEKRADVLTVVKERILTTSTCSIMQRKQEQCTFQGMLGLVDMLGSSVKVCVRDSNDLNMDSDVSLEIPSATVIAFSILELQIKKDGHYKICLQHSTTGGFEADMVKSWSSQESLDSVDGLRGKAEKQRTAEERELFPLAELPLSAGCALFQKLRETLRDRVALSYLQCALDDMCCGEPYNLQQQGLSESQTAMLTDILVHIGVESHSENSQKGLTALLRAAHLLVSALEELPDDTLSLMTKCSPDFLKAFNMLMCVLKKSSQPLSIHSLPALLQDDRALQLLELLLTSVHITLRKDGDRLWLQRRREYETLLLVLRLSICGLSLLCSKGNVCM